MTTRAARPGPSRGGWLRFARRDPITGLVAFPDFHRRFPGLLARELRRNREVLLAVGDVDDLKTYVEDTKRDVPSQFGHLAGNALMADLGRIARRWLATTDVHRATLSTFGGDEIIIAVLLADRISLNVLLPRLRDELDAQLPRSVSFAYRVCCHHELQAETNQEEYLQAIVSVDQALFAAKATRGQRGGLIIEVGDSANSRRPLADLVALGDRLVITFPGGRRDELVRGRRYRVALADEEFVAVAHEAEGQIVLGIPEPLHATLTPGASLPVSLEALADRGPMHIPADLISALTLQGLSLDELPEGDRRQLVTFVSDGHEPNVRRQRIQAVVEALRQSS
jgi:GGDEF domain-containing protein